LLKMNRITGAGASNAKVCGTAADQPKAHAPAGLSGRAKIMTALKA
jgi:hypothetical protein